MHYTCVGTCTSRYMYTCPISPKALLIFLKNNVIIIIVATLYMYTCTCIPTYMSNFAKNFVDLFEEQCHDYFCRYTCIPTYVYM